MTRTVMLPSRFSLDAIDQFTRQIVSRDGTPLDNTFVFDFEPLRFIDGSGYTVLSNTIAWLQSNRVQINFDRFDNIRRDAISYLDDCGFFAKYVLRALRVYRSPRNTTLPCRFIERSESFSFIEGSFSQWLAHTLQVDEQAVASIRTCLKEVFNNINDHSSKTTGFVHVQFYPNLHKVKITVSDFGVGIPRTIEGRFGSMTDAEALALAAKEGVTAKSQPNNMGAGLNYLIDRVTHDHGAVMIHSLSGFLNCYHDGKRQVRKAFNRLGRYPGTLIDITLDERLFVGDDYEEHRGEIEW